jgi:hypothetical protein
MLKRMVSHASLMHLALGCFDQDQQRPPRASVSLVCVFMRQNRKRAMKNKPKIATTLIAVAMGLALSSTSGFAAHKHKAAAQHVAKPLYDFVPPIQPLQPSTTEGPSSLNFNNTAWPGGQPARY